MDRSRGEKNLEHHNYRWLTANSYKIFLWTRSRSLQRLLLTLRDTLSTELNIQATHLHQRIRIHLFIQNVIELTVSSARDWELECGRNHFLAPTGAQCVTMSVCLSVHHNFFSSMQSSSFWIISSSFTLALLAYFVELSEPKILRLVF